MEGVIEEVLPNTTYRVKIESFERPVLASLNGRMRMNNIKVLAGDVVELEFSPYVLRTMVSGRNCFLNEISAFLQMQKVLQMLLNLRHIFNLVIYI